MPASSGNECRWHHPNVLLEAQEMIFPQPKRHGRASEENWVLCPAAAAADDDDDEYGGDSDDDDDDDDDDE